MILRVEEALLLDAGGGAELVPPMDQVHLTGDLAQIEGLLRGRVAPADHRHHLVAVERSIAGRAPRDPVAGELGFPGHAQLLRDGSCGQYDRPGIDILTIDREYVVASVRTDRLDRGDGAELGARVLGLLEHELGQLVSADAVGKAGVVLHPGGRYDLASGEAGLEHHRTSPAPRAVDGCRETGRPAAHDRDVYLVRHAVLPVFGWCARLLCPPAAKSTPVAGRPREEATPRLLTS